MSGSAREYYIEISVSKDGKDALVAYQDRVLDAATMLVINHKTGSVEARLLPASPEQKTRTVPCGTVSEKMAALLAPLQNIIWCREDEQGGESRIAVGEVKLMHRDLTK